MIQMPTDDMPVSVVEGDALDLLRALPSASIDSVVTDPPYPEISREYGRWTEAEWFELMNPVVEECRRVLKPSGSAVFVLQPNSERPGRLRTWLLEFSLKWAREWGMVQDAYWINTCPMPTDGANNHGLMRAAAKWCVWLGHEDVYRDQRSALWDAEPVRLDKLRRRAERKSPSQSHCGGKNEAAAVESVIRRGGANPMNVYPCGSESHGAGHPAQTPIRLARWWVRYITPPGGTVLDPFLGSGTTALAALAENRLCVGSERFPKYAEIARNRVAEAMGTGLLAGVT